MNIYAVRDRLIDYFMNPFAGPGDKEVLAAISQQVNGETNSAISQAPHHFEIWRLGFVTETGGLEERKELLADCSSLIRPGVRNTGEKGERGENALQGAKIEGRSPPGGDRGSPATYHSPTTNAAETASDEVTRVYKGPGGGHR